MTESNEPRSQPAKNSSASGLAVASALGAMIATVIALAAFVVLGIISLGVFGLQGVGICGAFGAAAGAALRGPGSTLARVLGGGIGGVIGGYFAVAAGEQFVPGTTQWAYVGFTFATLFAIPVAALVGGLIGLQSAALRLSGVGTTIKTVEHAVAPSPPPPK
jgi:hypothetical protein